MAAGADPIVAVRSAAFGARNLPFIHFHPTAKLGPSAEEVIREIKRLFKIEKNNPLLLAPKVASRGAVAS